MPSPIGSKPHHHVHNAAKSADDKPLNPAQAARAENPDAHGREFGALVSSIARAKHAPPPPTPEPEAPSTTDPTTTDPTTTDPTAPPEPGATLDVTT